LEENAILRPLTLAFRLGAVVCLLVCTIFTTLHAQDVTVTSDATATPFAPVDTSSPRATLETFLRLTQEVEGALLAYRQDQTRANADHVNFLGSQFFRLIDLSSVPKVSRRETGMDTLAVLLDIVGRLELPPIDSIPDADAFDDEDIPARWRIPGTPIRIVRIEEGPREGEFLFAARTVTIAPQFYQRIRSIPLRSSIGIESWQLAIPQIHGPAIPAGLVSALPNVLKQSWLDTPIWKILIAVMLGALAAILLVLWRRVINLRSSQNRIADRLRQVLTPVAIIAVVLALGPFIAVEVNVSGTFARIVDSTTTLLIYLADIWVFWLVVLAIFEWIILSPRIPDESLDANLLRLSARVIGFVGGGLILAAGVQDLGLPLVGLLASLGVGGLAVALAIRPTLENFIGGAILYMDRPVRIGDYCSFGTKTGTVESIGVRSTQIRALDRTLVSIPNSIFVNMEISNWAHCDRMLILNNIGLRYETEPDQLRFVLAKLREMFYAHPKIDRDTVRIRFVGYGASSLDVQIRVYALTKEMNEFYAIREDTLLRVNEIVRESGTGFAFPSQTLYMGRDHGLDQERSDAAMDEVSAWRDSDRLPFPLPAASRIEELADTLDYPPRGSPHDESSDPQAQKSAEPLSAELLSGESRPKNPDNAKD